MIRHERALERDLSQAYLGNPALFIADYQRLEATLRTAFDDGSQGGRARSPLGPERDVSTSRTV